MLKKIISVIMTVAAVWLTLNVPSQPIAAAEQEKTGAIAAEDVSQQNEYSAYIQSNEAFSDADSEIALSMDSNFQLAGDTACTLSDAVELANTGDSISWNFSVPEDGLYQPKIFYCATAGSGSDIELGFEVDDAYPYRQAQSIMLYRLWKNESDVFSVNESGDEYSSEQTELFQPQTGTIQDSDGFITEPLCIALSAGQHSIRLTLKSESLKIYRLVLEIPERLPTYEEYAAKVGDHTVYDDKEIVIEGEKADLKSQRFFIPLAARNDADVSPSSPNNKRMNYIGGTNWNSVGGVIGWTVEVPSDGWYKLGFHFRQNYIQESASYRKLTIDGVVPFQEASALAFSYKNGWQYTALQDNTGGEAPVYLTAGSHTIMLSVTLGELSDYAAKLKNVTDKLGSLYRKIVKITGETPDANRDYDLFVAIPELEEELQGISKRLAELADISEEISESKGGSNAQIVRKAAITIKQMLDVKYEAHTKLSAFYDNYSSLSSWLYEMQNMALDIDTVLLTAPNRDFTTGKTTWIQNLSFSFKRLLSTYMDDYKKADAEKNSLVLWLNWGRDQITQLENLIANDFTPKTGIKVNIKITATSLIQAGLSGNGPDFQLNVARTDPLNYAMRGLLYDLSQFDDYSDISARFGKTSTVPYQYRNGVYGLPSTESFNMLFVRIDIFKELGLQIPTTWDDFINCAKVISLNNMNCGMTSDAFMFMTQMGIPVYNDEHTATNLTSAGAVKAFSYMTAFYTKYKFPKSYNFFNRFRTGLMPMGIATYAENATLRAAAPEINGKWGMFEIPGFVQNDGTINNSVNGTGTACVILNWCKNKELAWEFLKWWTSDDVQYRYSVNIETVLGASGRYTSANMNAVYRLSWDKETLSALKSQFNNVVDLPEVPGSYYVSRSIQQVFWNVVNNNENVEDMLTKWIPEADDEIRRKTEEYVNLK